MIGYYNNPEATAAAFDEEGFFKTGDYGKLDEEGWIYITGRLKNLIILSNGKNVYPEEIETEISRIYGVNEVVVYEGLNADGSSKDCIVAEIYPDFDALKLHGIEDAQKYFKENINDINKKAAPYKKVQIVKIRNEEFEKNTSRKIVRFKINRIVD
jgi:long-chain acyl-CoA synthetase